MILALAGKLALAVVPDLKMSLVHDLAHRALVARGAEQWISLLAGHQVQRYAVRGRGAGPAVLLLHGLNGAASSMASLVPAVAAASKRVVLLDLPAHGRSPPTSEPLSANQYAQVVVAALEELAAETGGKVALVGNSLGGALAFLAAAERPELVSAVVGLNPAGAPKAESAVRLLPRGFPGPAEGAVRMGELLFKKPPLLFWLVARDIARSWSSPMVQKILADAREGKDVLTAKTVLQRLKAQVLVLWGADDRMLPQASLDDFRQIPGARVELIADCGHMPQLEQPGLVRRKLREFLAAID